MRVLGIDPGSRITGFGVIDIVQATAKTIEALNKLSLPAGVDIKIKASAR